MLNIGDVLQDGRYRVNAEIGSGGMATVYEIFDRRLQAKCALKAAFNLSYSEQEQFEREARILAQLDHPVLPRVGDQFSERGGQFLVMELVPGDNLEEMLTKQGKPFDVRIVLNWADQILDTLSYLHRQNPPVIHRDIKPANLKLAATGRIKLLDFGIAKQQMSGRTTIMAAQAVTPAYSPIEQFDSKMHTDQRSDIYALGATLYQLLTKQEPVWAPYREKGAILPGPHTLNPDVSPALTQVILHSMAIKAEYRFQNAEEFRAALRDLYEKPVPVQTGSRWYKYVGGAAAIVFVAALGYTGGSLIFEKATIATPIIRATTPQPGIIGIQPSTLAGGIPVPTSPPVPPIAPTLVPPPIATALPIPPTPRPTDVPQTATPQRVAPPLIIARSAWGAAAPTNNGQSQRPQVITLNHDGQTIGDDVDSIAMLRRIQGIHQRNWSDIAWHYIVDRQGNIYEGRDVSVRGDTNYHYDTNGIIAIGVLGDYDSQQPSQQQIESITQLMAWLCQEHNIAPESIYPHNEFANRSPQTNPKITSPGANFDINDLRRRVISRLSHNAVPESTAMLAETVFIRNGHHHA